MIGRLKWVGLAAAALIMAMFHMPSDGVQAKADDVTLRVGESGKHIALLQQQLSSKGYYKHPKITGYYGLITQQALESFQRHNGLHAQGAADAACLRLLFGGKYEAFVLEVRTERSCYAKGDAAVTDERPQQSLFPGDKGEEIQKAQSRLRELGYYSYAWPTGFYGPTTEAAVRAFQAANGLEADGVIGRQTRQKLYAEHAIPAAEQQTAARGAIERGASGSRVQDVQQATAQNVLAYANAFVGRPYAYGAVGPESFDSAGFTRFVFGRFGISLPWSAKQQGYRNYGKLVYRDELKPGDLLFFDTEINNNLCDSVGIYIGDGFFIHASAARSSREVRVDTIEGGYWARRLSWARRVLQ